MSFGFLADGVEFSDVGFDRPQWITICQADPAGPKFEVYVRRFDFQEIEAHALAQVRENAENAVRPLEQRVREVERKHVEDTIVECHEDGKVLPGIRGLTVENFNKCIRVKKPLDPNSPAIAERTKQGLPFYEEKKWRDVVWFIYVNSPNATFWRPINDFSTTSAAELKAKEADAKKH